MEVVGLDNAEEVDHGDARHDLAVGHRREVMTLKLHFETNSPPHGIHLAVLKDP
jgi:hypothetical protein